jgi:SLT domain-containing protein
LKTKLMKQIENLIIEAAVISNAQKFRLTQLGEEIAKIISDGFNLGSEFTNVLTPEQIAKLKAEIAAITDRAELAYTIIDSLFNGTAATVSNGIDANMQKISDALKNADDKLKSFAETIESTLINGINDGLSSVDFASSLMKQLQKAAIEAAILSSGVGAQMAAIGNEIATDIAQGLTQTNVSHLQEELTALYTQAQAIAASINVIFGSTSAASSYVNQTVTANVGRNTGWTSGYAQGTEYATAGYRMVGELGPEMMYIPQGARITNSQSTNNSTKTNTIVNNYFSPKAIDITEAERMRRQNQRELAFNGII